MTLRTKLVGGVVLTVTIVVLLAAVEILGTSRVAGAGDRLHRVFDIAASVYSADVSHDDLRAEVLAITLARGRNEPHGDAIILAEEEAANMLELLDHAAAADQDHELRQAVRAALPAVDAYAAEADAMIRGAGAVDAGAVDAGDLAVFDRSYRQAEHALAELTSIYDAAAKRAWQEGGAAETDNLRVVAVGAVIAALLIVFLSMLLSRSIFRSMARMGRIAGRIADGDLGARNAHPGTDEIAVVAQGIDRMADRLTDTLGRLEEEAGSTRFAQQVGRALDMAQGESQVHCVVERAMREVAAESPMELLLADSSAAHLERVAEHPSAGAPGCGVVSPFDCPAVRRAAPAVFANSHALDTCQYLRDRPGGDCSAVCVPISFLGRSLGVLHAAGPPDEPPEAALPHLVMVAEQTGQRLGTIRAFSRTEMQASTDPLTGVLNRRAFELRFAELRSDDMPFALAIADLDHFKVLNDTFGHETGDRALRHFTETMRSTLRDDDVVARIGGEEFAVLLLGVDAATAVTLLDRAREALAVSLQGGTLPAFTMSVGVADTSMGVSVDELLRIADTALYEAKAGGRDAVVCATALTLAVPRPEDVAGRREAVDAQAAPFAALAEASAVSAWE